MTLDRSQRQIHLAAHFPGVNNTTVWTDPTAGSQVLVLLRRELAGAESVEEGRVCNGIECHAAACPLMQAKP